ncbi:MAG: hypothetical protein K1X52_07865 [Pyrinomonadaceae bacterium]|nr:hypothetical protein [Pyrinomonadaceae bacterium]
MLYQLRRGGGACRPLRCIGVGTGVRNAQRSGCCFRASHLRDRGYGAAVNWNFPAHDTLSAEFGVALAELGVSHDQVQRKIAEFIPSFLDGTFGLCVADPSTGKGIARKEIFQEKLTRVTKNGSIANPDEMSRDELLELIDAYAKAAMPFSPAERPLSSRRRLVDELRPVVELR